MASKKSLNLVLLFCMFYAGTFAQLGKSYDVQDSSVIPAERIPQHSEFLAHSNAFPALPRSQYEIGLKVGAFGVSGDVRSLFPGFAAGIQVRKSLGYIFSLRGDLSYGTGKGLNFSPSTGWRSNSAWTSNGYALNTPVYYNYKTSIWDASLLGVVSLNTVRFHKSKSGFNAYLVGGLGGVIYDTKVDALNGTTKYNFSSITPGTYATRKETRKALKNLMDGTYETQAEIDPGQPKFMDKPFKPTYVLGAGVAFKLNDKVNLSIEDKFTSTKSDLLDAQQWQEGDPANPSQSRDYDAYHMLTVGLNLSIGAKSVEPLNWINPLDYAYNELNKPRHMQLPKPVLDDKDGDGVTDQFDNEPNTPAGAPVDARGVSRDTDGDGVPDYKDKELVTPSQCQPVDADGVGKCPEPGCCGEIKKMLETWEPKPKCNIGALPSISFKGKSVVLSKDAKTLLVSVAQKIKDNSDCKVAVIGYCASNKADQQLSWDRVNAIINYLVEKEGINADRFVFKYGQDGGDCNTVDIQDGTGDEGPTTVPAPHPNLRRKG